MKLFRHSTRTRNARTEKVYAAYEIAHTAADFIAAFCFLLGSVFFLWAQLETEAIWLFIVGSVFFILKPTIRLAREIQLWRMGRVDRLAKRVGD